MAARRFMDSCAGSGRFYPSAASRCARPCRLGLSGTLSAPPPCPLFSPVTLRSVTIANRVFVSPMCQYSPRTASRTTGTFVHLGSARSGARGSCSPRRRRCPPRPHHAWDTGIWSAQQAEAWEAMRPSSRRRRGARHPARACGRKASCDKPWNGSQPLARDAGGGARTARRRALRQLSGPRAMTVPDLEACVADFRLAADRALQAGFEVAEVQRRTVPAARVPLAAVEPRGDDFGGSLSNRMRFPLAVAARGCATRGRTSCRCWCAFRHGLEGGRLDLEQSIAFARELKRSRRHDRRVERRQCPRTRRSCWTRYRRPSPRPSAATPAFPRPRSASSRARAGRAHPRHRPGRRRLPRARAAPRSLWPRHAAAALGERWRGPTSTALRDGRWALTGRPR